MGEPPEAPHSVSAPTVIPVGQSAIIFIERGWYSANHVLVVGGRPGPVLIDTGHHEDTARTLDAIAAHRVDPTTLRLIVNTHCHWDHCGGNAALRACSGAPIAAGAATADIFARNDQRAMWLDYFGVTHTPLPADICWQDGDVVTLGGLPFEVIAAPGHAPDAIALYQPDARILISADALHDGDCGVLNEAVHGPDVLETAVATVERFAMYSVDVALPGHGPAITDVAASVAALRRRLHSFQADRRQLAWHFARRVSMAALLEIQPVNQSDYLAAARGWPWVADYAPRCGYTDGERFLSDLLDEFLARGLIVAQNGLLTSLVLR